MIRGGRRRAGVPLADAAMLARPRRRSAAVRAALAVLLVALLAGALWAAPRARTEPTAKAAVRSGTIVVLDVSSSVGESRRAVHDALARIIHDAGTPGSVG